MQARSHQRSVFFILLGKVPERKRNSLFTVTISLTTKSSKYSASVSSPTRCVPYLQHILYTYVS